MGRKSTGNTFEKGLVMDLNPISTPNNVMTSALNATIITFNGNEYVLQSDMGNGRVETAYLPSGYIPVGMVEFGGIIYVASYNPILNRGQLGSFPSPERNISTDEMSDLVVTVDNPDFGWATHDDSGREYANILYVQKVLFGDKLMPGDRFSTYAKTGQISGNYECLYDFSIGESNAYNYNGELNTKAVELYFATITDEGKISRLRNLRGYDVNGREYIIPEVVVNASGTPNLDSYRSLIESPYNAFNSKVSGQLLLIAELVAVDNFSASIICRFDEVEGAENENMRDAKIILNMSYESDPNIFLYGVEATITDSQSGDTEKHIFWPKPDGEEEGSSLPGNRVLEAELYTAEGYDIGERAERNLGYSIVPCMTWGPIGYLSRSGTIELDKVGSGLIELYEWRYFKNTGSLILGWALQAYPEEGFDIMGVRFIMSCLARDGKVQTIIYNVSQKTSYSGSFTETIPFDTETFKITANAGDPVLLPDRLYYVTIEVQYGNPATPDDTSKYKYFYRWLYTSGMFNEEYVNGTPVDFNPLEPNVGVAVDSTIEANQADIEQMSAHMDTLISTTKLPLYQYAIRQYVNKYNITGKTEMKITGAEGLLKLEEGSCKMTANLTNEDLVGTITTQKVDMIENGASFNLKESATVRMRENRNRNPFAPELPKEGEKPVDGELPEEWDFASDLYQNDIHLLTPAGGFTKEGTTSIEIAEGEIVVETLEYAKIACYMTDNGVVNYKSMVKPCCITEDDFLDYTLLYVDNIGRFRGTILPGLNDPDAGGSGDDPFMTWCLVPEDGGPVDKGARCYSGEHKEMKTSFVTKGRMSFFHETCESEERGKQFVPLLRYSVFALAIGGAGDPNGQDQGDIGIILTPNISNHKFMDTTLFRDLNWWKTEGSINYFSYNWSGFGQEGKEKVSAIAFTKLNKKWARPVTEGTSYITMMRLNSDHDLAVPINMVTPTIAETFSETAPWEHLHFDYMAKMLAQIYKSDSTSGTFSGVSKPIAIAYTDRIITDFVISMRLSINPDGIGLEIELNEGVTPEIPAKINDTHRQNLWTKNDAVTGSDKDVMPTEADDPNVNSNIKFNVTEESQEIVTTCTIQNLRNIQDLVNTVNIYLEGDFQTIIQEANGDIKFSSISTNSSDVYYISRDPETGEVAPMVLNNDFYLYDGEFVIGENNLGQRTFAFNKDEGKPVSSPGAFTGMLTFGDDGKLYLDDINSNSIENLKGNCIAATSTTGGKSHPNSGYSGHSCWEGFSLFAPYKRLKAYDRKFVAFKQDE